MAGIEGGTRDAYICRRHDDKGFLMVTTDMNDCQHAIVRRCDVNSADDGICLKSDNPDSGCEDILIEDCRIVSSASAIKFGTASYGGFRNVTIRRIEVYRSGVRP